MLIKLLLFLQEFSLVGYSANSYHYVFVDVVVILSRLHRTFSYNLEHSPADLPVYSTLARDWNMDVDVTAFPFLFDGLCNQ